MIGLRMLWYINRHFWIIFYRLFYRGKIVMPASCRFRFGFNIIIDAPSAKVKIGNKCFFNNYCSINALNYIEIGDNTFFGENVKIYDHNHKYSNPDVPIANQGFSSAPIRIGSNCWIGSNVVILKGVTIGGHCVIGAGCIIHKDIPANTIVVNCQNLSIQEIKQID